jgi:signal transduction histidine kinase
MRATPQRWLYRHSRVVTAGFLVVIGCFCALAEGPLWKQATALAAVNLAVSLFFACTGLLLRKEPGQRGTAWAVMLAGIFRSIDFIDAWNGPWPAYALVFGGVDRLFGAWALLRYPNPSLLRYQRVYLAALTAWMLAGRTLLAITSTAQWNGGPASWWWPALLPDERLAGVLNYVVNIGEGILGAVLLVLLVLRLARTSGLDRVVIAPIILAGIAAVLAASGSAVAMMLASLRGTPNGAYMTESVVDFFVPAAFLTAVVQRALLVQAARERLEQVRASRVRIIEAELAERRRLERDLHDGVQQHLLSIAALLAAAMTVTTDAEATAAFARARDGLREVLAELRDLAHGIHPALLSQGGLAVALEGVAERLPLPVRVSVPEERIGTAAEAMFYFVACEALTNVVKHANAASATVTVRIGPAHLDLEIADDGVGGIAQGSGMGPGRGLANIIDRVSALDGDVAIDSPPGKGTRLAVRIPCE